MASRFLFPFLFLLVSLNATAQSILDKKITVQAEMGIAEALELLSETAGVEFAYSERFFDKNKKVKLAASNEHLKELLQKLMDAENVGFKEIDGQIVFFKKAKKKLRKFTLSGFIEDASSGERLIAAAVFCTSLGIGTVTNEYGFYSITLPENIDEITISYLGYQEMAQPVQLNQNRSVNIQLQPALTLMEVVVTPGVETNQLLPSPANEHRLTPEDFKAAPDLGGKSDLIRIAQMLPGVQTGSDGFGGFHVRGGNADQNLVLLDGVPVYNPQHLLGIFSVFNTSVVKSTTFYRGSIPARFGGRVSSVMDVRTRDGNNQKWTGGGAFDFISVKGFAEGPFAKKKGNILVTGRLSHSDLLFSNLGKKVFFNNPKEEEDEFEFYDFNAKATYRFSDRDRLYFSYYQGDDFFNGKTEKEYTKDFEGIPIYVEEDSEVDLKWGNIIASLRWNHVFNPKLFANTTLTYSQYQFRSRQLAKLSAVDEEEEDDEVEAFFYERSYTDITDLALRTDFDYALNYKHHIRFGGSIIDHYFTPEAFAYDEGYSFDFGDIDSLDFEDFDEFSETTELHALEAEAYVEDEFKVGARWHFNLGLRASAFFREEDNFFNMEPRLMTNYFISSKTGIKASLTRNVQYLHRPVQNEINLPQDVWLPAEEKYPPQSSWQTTLGLAHELTPTTQVSIEGYFKNMENIYTTVPNNLLEEDELLGYGYSYGLEFFVKKQKGKWGGWLSYTLSKTDREFESDSLGLVTFNSRFDRRHDLKIYWYCRLNDYWNVSINGLYGSPMPKLFDIENTFSGEEVLSSPFYNRSNDRSKPYHRVDVALSRFWKKKKLEHTFKVSVYNVYNRKNPAFYRGFEKRRPVNLLGVLPGVYYGIKF